MQTAQHIVRQSCTDFKAWLAALKAYREDASSFTGKPKMPGYCKGETTTYLFTNQDAVIKDGMLKLPKTKVRIPVRRRHGARLMEVKVKPVSGGYELLLVYGVKEPCVQGGSHSAAIDFGVDNTMAVVSDTGDSLIFKGRNIKSINQYFNKQKSERVSLMSRGKQTTGRVWSKYLDHHWARTTEMSEIITSAIFSHSLIISFTSSRSLEYFSNSPDSTLGKSYIPDFLSNE